MSPKYLLLCSLISSILLSNLLSASPIDECYEESDSKNEVSECLDDKLSKSESSLDAKVAATRKTMQKISKESNSIYPIRSFNLSQQAFLMYRKSNCDWLFDKSYIKGGSGDILKDCLIRMNLDRIIELDRDYTFEPVDQKKSPSKNKKEYKKSTKKSKAKIDNRDHTDKHSDASRDDNNQNYDYPEYEAPLNEDLPDDCYLIPERGDCNGSLLRYYYYQDIGKCRAFLWGGCDGVVPFETMTECREVCVQNN